MKQRLFMLSVILSLLISVQTPIQTAAKIENRNWHDETIYMIMVDRFDNGDSSNDIHVNRNNPEHFFGGDFQGIIDHLDYIKGMGFTTVLLSPVFKNDEHGYHGNWPINYYETEEHYGSIKKFTELVVEVHERDMKLLVHFPIGTIGKNHPWVRQKDKEDWLLDERKRGDFPVVALYNNDVQSYFFDVAKWWIRETGIDGYLFSGLENGPIAFWNQLGEEIKSVDENILILGEKMPQVGKETSRNQSIQFDGFLNYTQNKQLRIAFSQPDQSTRFLSQLWSEYTENTERNDSVGSFMDHFNMTRFTNETIDKNKHPGPRWKLALTYLYTTPGIPMVLYGSEIAITGGAGAENHGIMNFRTDQHLVDYISKIGELRADLPSLTKGTMELIYENKGMIIYKRSYEEETTVIAINNTSETQVVTLSDEGLESGKELRGLLKGDMVRSNEKDKYPIVIDREEAEIYVLVEKTKINSAFFIGIVVVWIVFLLFLYIVWRKGKEVQRNHKNKRNIG